MKALQITLFIIANVIFIFQAGHDVHQLFWGSEGSVLDKFSPETIEVESEKDTNVLVDEYRRIDEEIIAMEKGDREYGDRVYDKLGRKKNILQKEIQERERKKREFRDVWIFTAYGAALIILGTLLYRRRAVWPGLSLVIAGFTIFEYWASPAYSYYGSASSEFHALLVSKTLLTFIALVALYTVWRLMHVASDEPKT